VTEQSLLTAILGVVAIGIGIQAVALVATVRVLRRLERRLDDAERELSLLRPRLERLGQVIENVADWTDEANVRLPRLATALEGTLGQVRGIARLGALLLVKPLRPLGTALALWQGLKSGAYAYRQLRPVATADAPESSPPTRALSRAAIAPSTPDTRFPG
jgi:hypothetical protein